MGNLIGRRVRHATDAQLCVCAPHSTQRQTERERLKQGVNVEKRGKQSAKEAKMRDYVKTL